MSATSPLDDRSGRRVRVGAGQKVVALGLVVMLMVAAGTWIGYRDTDQISGRLEELSASTADLTTLRDARIHFEQANQRFDAGVRTGGLEGLRSISAALTAFDDGRRSWAEFQGNVPPAGDVDTETRARIEQRLDEIRTEGEATAALVMSADVQSPEWQQLEAERSRQNQALREDFDIVEEIQGDALVAEVDRLTGTVDDAHQAVLVVGVLTLVLTAVGTGFVAVRAARREREQRRLADEREQTSRRNALDAKLQTALDMAETEDQALSVVQRALHEALPGRAGELLLAEAPSAELARVATTEPDSPGCLVPSPDRCPAARHGQRLVFDTPDALNACFYLQDRAGGPCSAVCAPVNVAGRAVGVVHVTAPEHQLPNEHEIAAIDLVARKASERLGTMRAFGSMTLAARTDPLTGLLNRRSVDASLETLDRTETPYAVAFADLDRFKALNDTYGHPVGDKALQLFAHVLRSSIRPGDLVGRYGGEEFVLVFPECDTDAAVRVLERVQANLAVALAASSVPPFTSSFGVAVSQQGRSYGDVVAAADGGLLRAKEAGRNRIEVESSHEAGSSPADPATA